MRNWWTRACGGRDVLTLALPLIISTSFNALMHFIDRLFLTWWNVDEMTASMHAGLVQWTMICFAFGVAQYVNTFVAQYHGAEHDERVGPSVWQGIWFGIFTVPVFLLAIPLAPWFFAKVGHASQIQQHEVTYFQILCYGAGLTIVSVAMSTFFTGRGETWVTMCVSGIAALVNIVFDYILIFDKFGLGIHGIAGAAWATVLAHLATVIAYGIWMYLPELRRRYGLTTGWRLDLGLMRRLIYYGGSSGAQMLIEGAGFTLLLLLIGRLGPTDSAATTLAFNVNIVAFIPMVGLGIAVSTLVGQKLGHNQPELAERATWSGLTLGLAYSSVFALAYFAVPDLFFFFHTLAADSEEFHAARTLAVILLKFVALYFLFDTVQIIFSFAIKGAGDTLFVLLVAAGTSVTCVAIGQAGVGTMGPLLGGGLYWWWCVMTGWILMLALCYYLRFLSEAWKHMRVIEKKYAGDVEAALANPYTEDEEDLSAAAELR